MPPYIWPSILFTKKETEKMKRHKRKRSEFTYKEIVRSLLWYYWDYLWEWWVEEQKYYRLYRIANAKFYKRYLKKDG